MTILRILGTLWALPFTILGFLAVMLVPAWKHTEKGWVWLPYWPRRVRVHNWTLHLLAGTLLPPGMDQNGDGDYRDPGDFRTGAQTLGSIIWFIDSQWNRQALIRHEERHVRQAWVFGIFQPLLYGGSYLVNLIRYRDSIKAYMQIPFEIDARKHESKP